MDDNILHKLKILADSAKYDISCSSGGSSRANINNGLGNTMAAGICHATGEDGRAVCLLKVLMTNHCIYDCAYCVNRRSNDVPRATLKVSELVELTINFYRRNYIEGLFLSSGVIRNPDYTMEALLRIAKALRREHRFNGYIHLKAIPGASPELISEAGLYADRMSVNIEIPSEQNLKILAPEKNFESVLRPMNQLNHLINENKEDRYKYRKTPPFVPAGQSTQLIIGVTPENDHHILKMASDFYKKQKLQRVFYSGYIPVNTSDNRLPPIDKAPLIREHRLYQADWLMRLYDYSYSEIVNKDNPFLDTDLDPKLGYALRNLHLFPIDLNTADYEMILRVPGIGITSARLIVQQRRFGHITPEKLRKMNISLKRAQYFIQIKEQHVSLVSLSPEQIRRKLGLDAPPIQLKLF